MRELFVGQIADHARRDPADQLARRHDGSRAHERAGGDERLLFHQDVVGSTVTLMGWVDVSSRDSGSEAASLHWS